VVREKNEKFSAAAAANKPIHSPNFVSRRRRRRRDAGVGGSPQHEIPRIMVFVYESPSASRSHHVLLRAGSEKRSFFGRKTPRPAARRDVSFFSIPSDLVARRNSTRSTIVLLFFDSVVAEKHSKI